MTTPVSDYQETQENEADSMEGNNQGGRTVGGRVKSQDEVKTMTPEGVRAFPYLNSVLSIEEI